MITGPICVAILVTGCLTAASALAAPRCRIGTIHGLVDGKGARVTMQVSGNDQACGTRLWVEDGIIPFTRLEQVTAPTHGDLTLNDPTHFAYHPEPGYSGRDGFDLIAFGNTAGGVAVTGRLHVAVSVTRAR